ADPGEFPVRLGDATAVRDHAAAGAAAVPVDRPEGEPGQVVRLGVVPDPGPGRRAGQFLLVGQAVHAGDADLGVGLRVGPAEGRLELVLQPFGGAHGAGVHVR